MDNKCTVEVPNSCQLNKDTTEIRHLHEKIDHLLLHQWQRLLEIQQMQLEVMDAPGQK